MKQLFSILSITLLIVTSFSSPSYAGNKKLKRAIAIGTAIGVGAAVLKKIKDKKKNKKKKNNSVSSNSKSPSSRSTNKAIQNALNAKGFNAGTPDGVLGKGSRAAISSYQQSIGAEPTGKLTKAQQASLLGAATLATTAAGVASNSCSNPMSDEQLQKVTHEFQNMTHRGDGFKIDKCRNITIQRGDKVNTGKLHQIFTHLNRSHHDTIYYGLINEGEWRVSGSGGSIYIVQSTQTKQQSAEWMIDMNHRTVNLLKLAGYNEDPEASKRQTILTRDLEELQTADFGEGLQNLFGAVSANSGANNSAAACYSISRQEEKTAYLNCGNGGTAKVWYHSIDKVWHYGLVSFTNHFESSARYACGC